jgi:hypothetical protein
MNVINKNNESTNKAKSAIEKTKDYLKDKVSSAKNKFHKR